MNPTTTGEANATVADLVREIVATHRAQRGALLPILHAVQEALGCVPREAIPVLADELNLSRADVHGVVSFYHDFRSEPAGRTTVRVCRAEACQALGAQRLVAHLQARYGVSLGETSWDRSLTAEQVFCLGNCALGPAAQVDGRLHGRLDETRLSLILEKAISR
jgi:formate dehydrogenase subunit gamma